MCNRTQNDAIWGLIALYLANQIAGNIIDFKMNVINAQIAVFATYHRRYIINNLITVYPKNGSFVCYVLQSMT